MCVCEKKVCFILEDNEQIMLHKFPDNIVLSHAGQRILCNNMTINTQANCQRLITSHLCQDGADEIILPSFSIWPCGNLTSSLMLTVWLLDRGGEKFGASGSFRHEWMNVLLLPPDLWLASTTSQSAFNDEKTRSPQMIILVEMEKIDTVLAH